MPIHGQAMYSKSNEDVIKLQDETANKALEKKITPEKTKMANDIVKTIDTTNKELRTARRLASGDTSVRTANEEKVHNLREHNDRMKKLRENAKAVTKTYSVLLHGVKIDALPRMNDMATFIKSIQHENASTPSLNIEWISWFGICMEDTNRASLVIELGTPEEGNRAIEDGIVTGSELDDCCVYKRQCRSKQCFAC